MPGARPVNFHRIVHWAGLALAAPVVVVALVAFYEWLRGGFPPTVTATDAVLVLLMLFASAGLVYGAIRAVGWIVLSFSGRR